MNKTGSQPKTFLHFLRRPLYKVEQEQRELAKRKNIPTGCSINNLWPLINTPDDLAAASMLVRHFAVAWNLPLGPTNNAITNYGKSKQHQR